MNPDHLADHLVMLRIRDSEVPEYMTAFGRLDERNIMTGDTYCPGLSRPSRAGIMTGAVTERRLTHSANYRSADVYGRDCDVAEHSRPGL